MTFDAPVLLDRLLKEVLLRGSLSSLGLLGHNHHPNQA